MSRILSFFGKSDGTSSVEFVFLFPAFVIILLSSVESGTMMVRNVLLERGVDLAVRELRLGVNPPKDEDELLKRVCTYAGFIRDCDQNMRLELVRVSTSTFNMPTTSATCRQKDELTQPALTYTTGADHDLMLLRACAIFNPYFPTTGMGLRLPKLPTGHYALTAAAAFVVEPT